jgi:flagellar basal-body rod protein FlgF/flagellar basal-body rod protein FlgG
MDAIANNVANADTVGFKRQMTVFQARYAEQTARGSESPGSGSVNDMGGGVMVQETKTDFSPGPMKRTEGPTDVAIGGEGFFVVQKNGQQCLTRAGNFRLTEQGKLVTQQNYPVLNASGSPIVIDPTKGPFEITPDGQVRQDGDAQNLALVRPASQGDLVRMGENLFRPLAATSPVPEGERQVAAGYLEMSGVHPATEMVELIETSRAIETNINMMQTQDQMLSELVSRVLKA